MVLIVTLGQKVLYSKPQKLRICHQYWKRCIFIYFSFRSWPMPENMLLSDKRNDLKNKKFPFEIGSICHTICSANDCDGTCAWKSPFLVIIAWDIISASVWKKEFVCAHVCVCVSYACIFLHRVETGYQEADAVKPQQWGKTTTDDSASVISGKQAYGVLCGVKPQPWDLKLCTAAAFSAEEYKKESWQNADQQGEEVETTEGGVMA